MITVEEFTKGGYVVYVRPNEKGKIAAFFQELDALGVIWRSGRRLFDPIHGFSHLNFFKMWSTLEKQLVHSGSTANHKLINLGDVSLRCPKEEPLELPLED